MHTAQTDNLRRCLFYYYCRNAFIPRVRQAASNNISITFPSVGIVVNVNSEVIVREGFGYIRGIVGEVTL